MEAKMCFICWYPAVTDINSENATSVSQSAGTAGLLKWAQKIKKVRIWDFIFLAVPGAYRNCCV